MKVKDLKKTVALLDGMRILMESDPAMKPVLDALGLDKIKKQQIRKTKKEVLDNVALKVLVSMIEFVGMSQNQAFKQASSSHFTVSRAKKLWFDTRRDNPDKIEDYRQQIAYHLLSSSKKWYDEDKLENMPSNLSYFLWHLRNSEPELFNWAMVKVALDSRGEEHEDLKPDYKKPDQTQEIDTLSLMKQIASTD